MIAIHIIAAAVTQIDPGGIPSPDASQSFLETVLSIVFGIIGALSLLLITISGLRYITADGDPQRISQAKNGIVYSVVGLAIALAAQAIVTFVVDKL